MSDQVLGHRDTAKGDRRFLKRSDAGRRGDDKDGTTFLGADEADSVPRYTSGSYLFLIFSIIVIGMVTIRAVNSALAPMLYDDRHITDVARQMHDGKHYATYDLNIETRLLRREHIRSLAATPDLAVMGASHWQEAHNGLLPDTLYYNAHVHRDYYEDIVTVVYWLVKHEKLPKRLVISLRDNQFTPPDQRTDFLWVPILEDYRAGAAPFFGITPHRVFENGLTPQLRQILSLEIMIGNVIRFLDADDAPDFALRPHPTLDLLRHDGSIYWSQRHRDGFTTERTEHESRLLAEAKQDSPPVIDPAGVAAVEQVFAYLQQKGVEVYLAHPPFNPLVWDALDGTPYMRGLERFDQLVAGFATRYGFTRIGSFNPHDLGCTSDMYIDGEHSSPECLGRILLQTL